MNKEIEDDWNPDPAEKRTILNLKKVVFLGMLSERLR